MILSRHNELPSAVPLFGHTPYRADFSWRLFNPHYVKSPADLPRYLVFGTLDAKNFARSDAGWSARWRGAFSDEGELTIMFHAQENRYIFSQSWRGIAGKKVAFSANTSLEQAIAAAFDDFYAEPPTAWDRLFRRQVEESYQVNVVEQPKGVREIVEIPDGIFRTIAFPIAINNMRPMWRWLREQVAQRDCPYPVYAESRLVFHALNFVESKAPLWTGKPALLLRQSLSETGLPPLAEPVREVAEKDAAWTLRRLVYFLLVKVPFSALTDFLDRVESENGPVRVAQADPLRFDLRPIIFSSGLEQRARNLVIWDAHRTVRSFIQWTLPGREKPPPMSELSQKNRELNPTALLQLLEEIGAKMHEKAAGLAR